MAIEIDNKSYPITNRGDFRMILDCFSALSDKEIPQQYRIMDSLKIFYEDINSDEDIVNVFGKNVEQAVKQMYSFFDCFQDSIGMKASHNLIDWESDAQLVCAAVNNVAQTEIRSEPYLHWFTFMGYYISVGESMLATVVGIRDKKHRGKKLEKYEKEFVNNNPQYFIERQTDFEKQEAEDAFDRLWNKNSKKEV